MTIDQVGISRTVLGSNGSEMDYIYAENKMNETMKMILSSARYNKELIGKYELLDNSYRASGGFENGDYLIPHPSERAEKYLRRQHMAYFPNYVKPVVDAHVNPIFKNEPTRQGLTEYYSKFVQDVDGNKTTLTRFMKKAAIRAKLHGVEFIVVDMEQVNTTVTKKEIEDNRLYPYVYLVSPAQVVDWSTDKFGKLNYFKYFIQSTTVDKDGNKKTIIENWTWTDDKCYKEVDGTSETFTNNIGVIPIVPVYGAINDSDDLIPQSDVYAIAKVNYAIYNATSELRERNRAQAFSILTFPIDEDSNYENEDTPLVYGTADCLLYKGATPPSFITPPSDPSDTILNEINFLIKEIYRMANLQLVTGVQQSNVSGLAKMWDNQNLFQTILELSQGLAEAENKLKVIFGKYMDEDTSEISIAYNNQFGIVDATAVLTNAVQSLSINISPMYNEQIKKQVIRATLNDVSSDIVEEVIADLENSSTARDPLNLQAKVVQPVSGSV